MANTIPSPNMNMPVPVVAVDPGPDWATNIDACLSVIDSHNHTAGQGVAITPDAMSITSDLPFNDNNLTSARSIRFQTQASPINQAADLGCLYESGVDLYYNDGAGNQVRITQSGSVTGASGTITGLPSGTASASFAGSTFTFQSATNTPASMVFGPAKISRADTSGFGVTLSASSLQAANYGIAFPSALPLVQSVVGVTTGGNLNFNTLATGTTGSDFNITYAPNAYSFNIPDAGAGARGLVTPSTQTFGGDKTFEGRIQMSYATEVSAQYFNLQQFNLGSSASQSMTITGAGWGLALCVCDNDATQALIMFTSISSIIVAQNGSSWGIGSGTHQFSYNNSINVVTITRNTTGTATYAVTFIVNTK
jgi:hypothetical protein